MPKLALPQHAFAPAMSPGDTAYWSRQYLAPGLGADVAVEGYRRIDVRYSRSSAQHILVHGRGPSRLGDRPVPEGAQAVSIVLDGDVAHQVLMRADLDECFARIGDVAAAHPEIDDIRISLSRAQSVAAAIRSDYCFRDGPA